MTTQIKIVDFIDYIQYKQDQIEHTLWEINFISSFLLVKIINNKKKKRRMRILGARIFSKSFGGKIKPVQTDVNKETTLAKKLT